jgi:hypothetical protein
MALTVTRSALATEVGGESPPRGQTGYRGYDACVFENEQLQEPSFGRQLRESIEWFLINGTDLMPHLEYADPHKALYVGRRVEPCWRALERFTDNWLQRYGPYDGVLSDDLARIAAEAARVPSFPEPGAPATSWAASAHGAFQVAGDAVHRLEPRRDVVPVQMRIARHACSAYRVAKYNWIAIALDASEMMNMADYMLEY